MIIRRIFLIAVTNILFFTMFFAIGNKQVIEAASFTSKYTISINEEIVAAKVYLKNGRTYIPLKTITNALGYTISYSQLDELNIFHNYDIDGASSRVSMWGNEKSGYSIMKRKGDYKSPDDIKIYEPKRKCVKETDNCKVIENVYEGPFLLNNTLYVPVRFMAAAFDLKLNISKNNIIYLTN